MNQFEKEIVLWAVKVVDLLKALTDEEAISHFESAWEFNDIVDPKGIEYFQQALKLIEEAKKIADAD